MPGSHWHYDLVTSQTAALALVALLSLGAGAAHGAAVHVAVHTDATTTAAESPPTPPPGLCPVDPLPDGDACVHVVVEGEDGPEAEAEPNAHHDKRGRWIVYDQIPRRPERPADYDAYRYPVPCTHACVVSGYD